ncbi:MAG: MerR family transcriptional regulator [Campylobacterota bacterium]|nr:MerR family transcriptional regulator [Campylobacterota bacterium]
MPLSKSYCQPVYLISEVSKILDIHPQTLRQYEREGLVTPSRTNGKIRLYSQENIDYIKEILLLTRVEGINLAGVDKILKLQLKITELELSIKELNKLQIDKKDSTKALVVKKSQYDIIIFDD